MLRYCLAIARHSQRWERMRPMPYKRTGGTKASGPDTTGAGAIAGATLRDLLQSPAWETEDYHRLEQDYWSYIRDLHFDPKEGSPFWLDRVQQFRVNPSKEGMSLQEFIKHPISHFDEDVLRKHPWHYFVPRSIRKQDIEAHTSSGSVAAKKETYWSKDALEYATRYGDYIFDLYGTPRDIDWLVTGTILFYRIVKGIVDRRGGLVYADLVQTRESKRSLEGALGLPPDQLVETPLYQQRVRPVIEYYRDTLQREHIGGLVAVLFMLPAVVEAPGFENVKVIYLSGMAVPLEQLRHWRQLLPDRRFITSYGHHQAGLCFAHPDFDIPTYYPPAPLSLIYVVQPDNPFQPVKHGERGRIRLLRMDQALLWVQTERDFGERVGPHASLKWDGVRDVKSAWD